MRYPIPHPIWFFNLRDNFPETEGHGIAVINWLTFLGHELYESLNKKKVPSDISVLPLGKGACILRAGSTPQLGDLNKKDSVPIYRAVGQFVADLRATQESFEDVLVEGMTEKEMDQWLQRFFI